MLFEIFVFGEYIVKVIQTCIIESNKTVLGNKYLLTFPQQLVSYMEIISGIFVKF